MSEEFPHIPEDILKDYEVHEWRNASSVLIGSYEEQWEDIVTVLREFHLPEAHVHARGGRKSPIAKNLDGRFYDLGWEEKSFDTSVIVDEKEYETPTHGIDCVKGKVACEVEWNNKDPFFDRDLNNFRLLYDLRAIGVGVIITKADELKDTFQEIDEYPKYGASTTWMKKLLPRIDGGGGGGCPILVFGITNEHFIPDDDCPECN